MTSRRRFMAQLYELGSEGAFAKSLIQATGGKVYVTTAGDPTKASITDKDGAALANPMSLTNGSFEFYTLATVESVDVFIMAPGGQFVAIAGLRESRQDIGVDVTRPGQVMIIPVSITDYPAATETDSGFDMPVGALVQPTPAVKTHTVDATEDLDVGILASETNGDADGFIDGVSVATAVLVAASQAQGANTMGALLEVQDSANAGDLVPRAHAMISTNGQSVSVTTSAGSDTVKAYVYLPYVLCNQF